MSVVDFIETDESFVLRIADQVITRCSIDYALTLVLGSGATAVYVTVEQPFWFRSADGGSEAKFVPEREPEAMGPGLSVMHRSVMEIVAHRDGVLEVVLQGGAALRVPPSTEFEAWNIVGPDDMRLVARPGGDLAVWKPRRA
jgi:hypothetical protein